MKIGIIGRGQVGETLEYGFKRLDHQIVCHDIKIKGSRIEDVLDTQVVFVCVPTPNLSSGQCDTTAVKAVCNSLHLLQYGGVVTIKSTVPPGTTDGIKNLLCPDLHLAFCPEFLRERARYSDFVENHDVCIIGASDEWKFETIKRAHGSLPKEFVWVTAIEAEFCKYFANCLNALRITFANEFYDVCERAGVDYQNVKNAITKKKSIGNWYLDSSQHFRAFGGSCLPKDTSAFLYYATKLGADAGLLSRAVTINRAYEADNERADNKLSRSG